MHFAALRNATDASIPLTAAMAVNSANLTASGMIHSPTVLIV